ncbi:MAG: hypothetical protein Q9227_005331 [Pyrenula ochraceoflavens]
MLSSLLFLSSLATLAVALPPQWRNTSVENLVGPPAGVSRGHLPWAAMGDSWASGVTYDKLAYDKDAGCLRIKDAYSVQLSKDHGWTNDHQEFKFVACSGSRIAAAVGQAQQMSTDSDDKTKIKRKFATMTLGGNDAGFYDVAVQCFYQYNPRPGIYGKYPDKNSACKKALAQVRDNIALARTRPDEDNPVDIWGAIQSVMDWQRDEAQNPDFELYVTGYAHFFNVDDDSTWCNDQSFGVLPLLNKPLLSLELRREVNDLTTELNRMFRDAVLERQDKRVHFVDISPRFDKHRWCEPDQKTHDDLFDYSGKKAWFFNFRVPQDVPIPCVKDQQPGFPLLDFNTPADQIEGLIPECLKNYLSSGQFLRPFHPIKQGHKAIKKHIEDAIGNKY